MGNFWRDLRYSVQALRKKPTFTATAVLTLSLGIAVSTVVFSWMDIVLLQPLPGTANDDRLVVLESTQPDGEGRNISYPDFRDFRDNLRLSSPAISLQNNVLSLGEGEHAQRVWAELVSGNYFTVLGVKPLLGRFFLPEEQGDKRGAYPVAILSSGLWRTRFRSDPRVLGSTVRVNGNQLTIIGVTPPEFHGLMRGLDYELWVPLTMGPQLNRIEDRVLDQRTTRMFNAVSRLQPGASIEQANAEQASVARELAARYPRTNENIGARLMLEEDAQGNERNLLRGPLKILLAMCLVVLLIACVNVANLLLARSIGRQNELSIRLALGASRAGILQQLLIEALVLAGMGALLAVPMALWMGDAVSYLAPVSIGIPIRIQAIAMNTKVLSFTVLISVVAALVSGISPALRAMRSDVQESLKEEGRSGTSSLGSHRLRDLFVISEVALAFVALIGAGLFVKSFQTARTIYPGFDAANVLVSRFYTSMSGYNDDQRQLFCSTLRQRIEGAPGITGVTYADTIPLGFGMGPGSELLIEGYTPARGENMGVGRSTIAPGYFSVLHIPLLQGRDFTDQDDMAAQPVAIVNEPFAQRFYGGQNPVGRKIRAGSRSLTIIGLVPATKAYTLTEPARPYFFVAFRQVTPPKDIVFFIRTNGDPRAAMATIRSQAASVDPNAGAFDSMPLLEYIGAPLFPQRFAATLLSALGILSLVLAAVGLYSVMAYAVSQRTQEIGIRMALGARPRDVLAMVVHKGGVLAGTGVLIGVAAALAGTRLIAGLLVNISATDPLLFVAAGLFLMLVGLMASLFPALRASKVDSIRALRHQ